MSSKKQQPYVTKSQQPVESNPNGVVPPRYQPPPLPSNAPGILKHAVPPKDGKQHYPSKPLPDNNLKVQVPFPNPYPKQYPYPYPPSAGTPQSRLPVSRSFEDDLRIQSQIHQDLIRGGAAPPPIQYDDYHREEMLKFVRKPDQQFQNLVGELRSLKEANQRLADDNQELRDLCCFLDDDRQKGRKLAREWQRFGRYTASVMRQEVSAYQNKLRELDNKQQELIKDNLELKELCLYLDEERGGNMICPSCGSSTAGNLRDDGDGSSSSTNADEPAIPQQFTTGNNVPRRTASRERLLHESLARQRNTLNDQTMQYVRSLEQRVKQLEDDKRGLTHKINQLATSVGDPSLAVPSEATSNSALSGRPEAVVRALQVLEVREQLEMEGRLSSELGVEIMSDNSPSVDMDDGEKALVREMCNVVWRKLEDAPQQMRR